MSAVPIVHLILTSRAIASPNLPVSPGSLTTALHVASEVGRLEIGESLLEPFINCIDSRSVQLLLNHPKINDTIRDDQGRTALECAANAEIAAVIDGESRQTWGKAYKRRVSNVAPVTVPR